MRPKHELVRFVRSASGGVTADTARRMAGRGAYLCLDPHCWELARKRRSLERSLRASIPAEEWERLRVGILAD